MESHPVNQLNSTELSVNEESAIQFFSEERYSSKSAALREMLGNAMTACQEVEREDYEPKVKIIGNGNKVVVEDNGIGVTKKRLEGIVQIADGDGIHTPDTLQKWGIGLLSGVWFSETDEIIFETNPRDDLEPYSFKYSEDGVSEASNSPKDDFGTRVILEVPDKHSEETIRGWVRDIVSHSPISTRIETDLWGEKRDYEPRSLEDFVDNIVFSYEDEFIEVVISSYMSGTHAYLVGIPIEDSGVIPSISGHNIYVNFKREDGVVVEGPNKGMSTSSGPADSEVYIDKDNLSEEDVTLPEPTSDRDRLKENQDFAGYLEQLIHEEVSRIIEEDLLDVSNASELMDVVGSVSQAKFYWNVGKSREIIDENSDVYKILRLSKCSLMEYQADRERTWGRFGVLSVFERNDPEDVYVGKSINIRRAAGVHDIGGQVFKIRRDSPVDYDVLEKYFNFNKLKDFPLEADKMRAKGVSQETINKLNVPRVTPYTAWNSDGKYEVAEEDIPDKDHLYVLFPDNEEDNVSDHRNRFSRKSNIRGMRATAGDSERLLGFHNVYKFQDIDFDRVVGGVNLSSVDNVLVVESDEVDFYSQSTIEDIVGIENYAVVVKDSFITEEKIVLEHSDVSVHAMLPNRKYGFDLHTQGVYSNTRNRAVVEELFGDKLDDDEKEELTFNDKDLIKNIHQKLCE